MAQMELERKKFGRPPVEMSGTLVWWEADKSSSRLQKWWNREKVREIGFSLRKENKGKIHEERQLISHNNGSF